MSVFLDKIDAAPIANSEFDMQFLQWIWVLVDSLNENLGDIEISFNLLGGSPYTALEITNLQASGQLRNGILLYDTTNNVYVGRENGILRKFTTAAYP